MLFSCFSCLEDSVRFPHKQINMIEAMLAMPKVQPKVPAQPPASGVGRASPVGTGQEKVIFDYFQDYCGPIAKGIKRQSVRERENSVLVVSSLLHVKYVRLFVPLGCTLELSEGSQAAAQQA